DDVENAGGRSSWKWITLFRSAREAGPKNRTFKPCADAATGPSPGSWLPGSEDERGRRIIPLHRGRAGPAVPARTRAGSRRRSGAAGLDRGDTLPCSGQARGSNHVATLAT